MRKIVSFLSFLLFVCVYSSLYAQGIFISSDTKHIPVEPQDIDKFTVVDTAKLVVTYDVQIINDPTDTNVENDIQVLEIGNRYAKSYSKWLYEGDSIFCAYTKKGARNAPWFQKNIPMVEVYRNYVERRTTVNYRLFGLRSVYVYRDDYPVKIDWQLTKEKKQIFSYTCQKATGTFRGRTYEAWFTQDIPLQEGPYKFGGLPGLILEICDTQKHYVYTCIGIERPKSVIPIKYWKWSYQEISREKLTEAIKRAYKNPSQHLKLVGMGLFMQDGIKGDAEKISFPYNPIELE